MTPESTANDSTAMNWEIKWTGENKGDPRKMPLNAILDGMSASKEEVSPSRNMWHWNTDALILHFAAMILIVRTEYGTSDQKPSRHGTQPHSEVQQSGRFKDTRSVGVA